MRDLPRVVQRAPSIFYGVAALYFIATVVLTHLQLQDALGSGTTSSPISASYVRMAIVSAWLQAAGSAIHIVAYGVLSHILLAIWRNGRAPDSRGDSMTKGRLLPFRTGDIAMDSLLAWAVRERPEMLLRWGQPANAVDGVAKRPEGDAHDRRVGEDRP